MCTRTCMSVCVCIHVYSVIFFSLQRNPIFFLFFFFFLNELLSSFPQPKYIYKMKRGKRILNTYFEIFHGKCYFLFTVSEIYLKTQSSFPPTQEYSSIVMSFLHLPFSSLYRSATFSKLGSLTFYSYIIPSNLLIFITVHCIHSILLPSSSY